MGRKTQVAAALLVVVLAILVALPGCGEERDKKRDSGVQGSVNVNAPPVVGPYTTGVVWAIAADGTVAASVATGVSGQYSLVVDPGTYTIAVTRVDDGTVTPPDSKEYLVSEQATVADGEFTDLPLMITKQP